jgi:hypothetical protein
MAWFSVMEVPMRPLLIRKSPVDSPSLAPGSDVFVAAGRPRARPPADGHLNIAALAVDRHAHSARADRTAFRFLGADGNTRNVSYRELAELTDRFGNALTSLGVVKGDCVFVLCDRVCALYVAVLGALKVGAVVSPLFQSFGPEPIRNRIAQAAGKVLVTSSSLYQRRVASLRAELPSLEHVLLIDDSGAGGIADTLDLATLLRAAPNTPALVATGCRRPGPAAFHQRHDRPAEGRPARPRRRPDALRQRQERPRPASGRRVLVHRRSGLGDRHLVRHHCALVHRRHQHRGRGRLRSAALDSHSRKRAGQCLVHRADGDPAADEGRSRTVCRPPFSRPALHRQRWRGAQPGSGVLGTGGLRATDPRQLVAERNRRHHDCQHRRPGHQARLDGPPPARRGRARRPACRRASRSR